ncbi:hypothetical protein DCC85_18675 [Paenibacillus sp. CAA11]|uniref:C40 family peptidase n=1 Tax=Paenibacillus sp. CAA11 TaxID=1532905 RepID=UPI000D38C7F3|nr:C40 family peptidase [Paenibacillus sp. CAA11]AWB45993.1 hypothetical protein DCC85_18675 [Paenibacillus sp. CAA11]
MKMKLSAALLSAAILLTVPALPASTYASTAQTKVQTGTVVSGVNLRDKPSTSGKIIGLLKTGENVTILDSSNSYFYKVKTSSGTVGYASSADKYIQLGGGSGNQTGSGQTGYAQTTVNLRDKPSMSSTVIGFLYEGDRVQILDDSSKYFYKVKTASGIEGYVSSQEKYVRIGEAGTQKESGTSDASTQNSGSSESYDSRIEKVIAAGKKYLGTPYEYGSDRSTTDTFDCSDFVRTAYREALNITLPADSRSQGAWVKENSKAVYDAASLKAGDLMFFMDYKGSGSAAYQNIDKDKQRITHVAIYLGDGKMLHTYSVASGGVRIDSFGGSWEKRFLFGGSVIQ